MSDFLRMTPPSPARLTTTFYSYLEQIVGAVAPRSASMLIGLRWSFGLPSTGLDEIAEYSFPLNPTPFFDALNQRSGICITRHEGDVPVSLYDHVASGRTAVAVIDVYEFHFRPAYREVHNARSVLVRRLKGHDELHVEDGWGPAVERGVVHRTVLERARYSPAPLELEREPLFAGKPLAGEWYEVDVSPPTIDDPTAWMHSMLTTLADEIIQPREDERGVYGIAAYKRFRDWLEAELEAGEDESSITPRRHANLLLRPELGSRLFLFAFLYQAAHWLKAPRLRDAAVAYRDGLGSLQAAMDTLTKTVRIRRPEYDEFIRRHLRRAIEEEERLIDVVSSVL